VIAELAAAVLGKEHQTVVEVGAGVAKALQGVAEVPTVIVNPDGEVGNPEPTIVKINVAVVEQPTALKDASWPLQFEPPLTLVILAADT